MTITIISDSLNDSLTQETRVSSHGTGCITTNAVLDAWLQPSRNGREKTGTHEATPGNHKQRRYQETQPIKNGRNVPWRKTDPSQQLLNLLLASLGKR